jgi:hypothetical protein
LMHVGHCLLHSLKHLSLQHKTCSKAGEGGGLAALFSLLLASWFLVLTI